MQKFLYRILLNRGLIRPPRRIRLLAAFLFSFVIIVLLLSNIPDAAPRYYFTLGGRLTLLTPSGFRLGQLYDFDSIDAASELKELVLPLPDSRKIIFKYPQVVAFGNPFSFGGEISQSVDFTVTEPSSHGLIQIWHLSTSFEEFLKLSRDSSSIEYLSFESKEEKVDHMPCIIWEYTFVSGGNTIKAIEAFLDDSPYMYRISIFADENKFNDDLRKIFDDMLDSVSVQ